VLRKIWAEKLGMPVKEYPTVFHFTPVAVTIAHLLSYNDPAFGLKIGRLTATEGKRFGDLGLS